MAEDIVGKIELTGQEAFADAFAATVVRAVQKGQTAGQRVLAQPGAGGIATDVRTGRSIAIPPMGAGESMADYAKRLKIAFDGLPEATEKVSGALARQKEHLKDLHGRYAAGTNAVRGFSAALILMGNTGLAATTAQIGYAIVYMGRFTQSAGGMAAAFVTLGSTLKAFAISLGPVGWALIAIGAAASFVYSSLSKSSEITKQATEANKKATEALNEHYRALTKKRQAEEASAFSASKAALAAAGGGPAAMSAQEAENIVARTTAFTDQHGWAELQQRDMTALNNAQARLLELQKDSSKQAQEQWEAESRITANLQKQSQAREKLRIQENAELKVLQEKNAAEFKGAQDRQRAALEGLATAAGAPASQFAPKGLFQEIAVLEEKLAAAKTGTSDIPGFKIGSVDAMRTRFGEVTGGTKFGEQNEQRRQTENLVAIKRVLGEIKQLFTRMGFNATGIG